MIALLIALNVLAGVFLIGVVLLQSGKGADMGAAFGGASTTVFGASGAGNLLTKITAVTAAIFMGTSLVLAVVSTRDQSVFAGASEPTPMGAPAAMPPPPGQPTDGVDAKAAAEARGQEPLVADETDRPANAEAPGSAVAPGSDSSDLGPAGQAGALNSGGPPSSGEERAAAGENAVENPAGAAPENPAGPAANKPAGDAVKNPTGAPVGSATGAPPANPTGAAPANPTGSAPANPAGSAPAPAHP